MNTATPSALLAGPRPARAVRRGERLVLLSTGLALVLAVVGLVVRLASTRLTRPVRMATGS